MSAEQVIIRIKQLIQEKENGNVLRFATKAGLGRGAINGWLNESKPTEPKTESLIAICKGFGVSANWLLLGEGEKDHKNPVDGSFNAVLLLGEFFKKVETEKAGRVTRLSIIADTRLSFLIRDDETLLKLIGGGKNLKKKNSSTKETFGYANPLLESEDTINLLKSYFVRIGKEALLNIDHLLINWFGEDVFKATKVTNVPRQDFINFLNQMAIGWAQDAEALLNIIHGKGFSDEYIEQSIKTYKDKSSTIDSALDVQLEYILSQSIENLKSFPDN
ncbi:MAG: helix-turn-helix transcriptional regulator [SAR324 cluster bacterium]|nr:helix-turn-helix transcriptional regulator [SAR324 cluster bacterium]